MNYYCLYCHKRFYMDEGEGEFASCPFCSSEDIEPDVEEGLDEDEAGDGQDSFDDDALDDEFDGLDLDDEPDPDD